MQDNNNVLSINNKIKNNGEGKFSYRSLLWIFLVIILVALTLFAYNSYKQDRKIKDLLEKNTFELATLSNHLTETRTIVDQNQNIIHSMKDSIDSISAFENQPLLNVTLLTLQNLIMSAESSLKLNKNIKATVELLKIADKNLSRADALANTELKEFRKVLLTKIEQLNQIKSVDLSKVLELLDDYQKRIDSLNLADFLVVQTAGDVANVDLTSSPDAENPPKIKSWKKWLHKICSDFITFMSGLIKIRNLDDSADNVSRLLDEGQINLLKIYFKVQSTLIKTNFLQHDNQLAGDNIEILINNTNLYFNNSLLIKRTLIDLLEKIKSLNVEPEQSVDLNDLSAKINAFRNKTAG